jgi:uncharacterized membrane protein YciS (DUF1049 family)
MNPYAFILASTPQCATATGHLIGTLLLAAFVLAILICAIGWSRASSRANRAEGALDALTSSATDGLTRRKQGAA